VFSGEPGQLGFSGVAVSGPPQLNLVPTLEKPTNVRVKSPLGASRRKVVVDGDSHRSERTTSATVVWATLGLHADENVLGGSEGRKWRPRRPDEQLRTNPARLPIPEFDTHDLEPRCRDQRIGIGQ
jgi:hypothetical protein